MSVEAMSWAFAQRGISSSQKFVLVALADVAGETDECCPSIEDICFTTALSRESVLRALKGLCKKGLVREDAVPGEVTIYQLVGVDHYWADDTPQMTLREVLRLTGEQRG